MPLGDFSIAYPTADISNCFYDTSLTTPRHCVSLNLTHEEYGTLDGISFVRIVFSVLGMLGSSSIIMSAIIRRQVFNAEVYPIFIISVADCILSVLWISGSAVWFSSPDSYSSTGCYAILLLTSILECVSINLSLVYAILAYIRIKNTSLTRFRVQLVADVRCPRVVSMYIIAWVLPILMITIPFVLLTLFLKILETTNSCSCRCSPCALNIIPYAGTRTNGTAKFTQEQDKFVLALVLTIVLNYLTVFIALIVLYHKLLKRITFLNKQHVQQTYGSTIEQMSTVTLKGRSKAILRIVLFLTVFAVCGFFNLVILLLYVGLSAYKVIHFPLNRSMDMAMPPDIHASVILLYPQSVTLTIQGFFNALVYGWTRDDFVLKLRPDSLPVQKTDNDIQESLKDDGDHDYDIRFLSPDHNSYAAEGYDSPPSD